MALLFVACGVLARWHESSTVHVRERTGAYVHPSALAGQHAGPDADIHGQRDPDAHGEPCALLAALHQFASADIAPPRLTAAVRTHLAHDVSRAVIRGCFLEIYRLAPKTSPPAQV